MPIRITRTAEEREPRAGERWRATATASLLGHLLVAQGVRADQRRDEVGQARVPRPHYRQVRPSILAPSPAGRFLSKPHSMRRASLPPSGSNEAYALLDLEGAELDHRRVLPAIGGAHLGADAQGARTGG